MCVRYAAYQIKDVIDFLGLTNCDELDAFKDNYNASPGQYLPIITCKESHKISLFKWGLIPPWYKTGITAANMFNVEAAAIARRPLLRTLLKVQRCIIITSGYYEWKLGESRHAAYRVKVKDAPFTLLAGLYEASLDKRTGEKMDSFTIITAPACQVLEGLYQQMPLTLTGDYPAKWLDLNSSAELVDEILFHDARHEVEVYEVSDKVTDARNNLPGLIVRI